MKIKPNIVILTGAGISAESGLKTFRDSGGLWEGHDVLDVASIEGWNKNPDAVLRFYNQRRRQLAEVLPNAGHLALKQLEDKASVFIVTQNVDDLHERAGSSNILHLHGELVFVKPISGNSPRQFWGYKELNWGDCCAQGIQLRPDIVWFGESVPNMYAAAEIVSKADELWIVGTSLEVYPAASLVDFAPLNCKITIIDPNRHEERTHSDIRLFKGTAAKILPQLVHDFIQNNTKNSF